MGYLPKHVKRAHQRKVLCIVARAALAGATFVKHTHDYKHNVLRKARWDVRWDEVHAGPNVSAGWFNSRRAAAINFLLANGFGDTLRDLGL